jgi:hypothetical protein
MSNIDDVGFALNVDGGDVQDLDYIEVRTTEQRDVDVTKTHKEMNKECCKAPVDV